MKINEIFKLIKRVNKLNKIFGQKTYCVCLRIHETEFYFKTLNKFENQLIFTFEKSIYQLIMNYNFYDLEKANDFGIFKIYISLER